MSQISGWMAKKYSKKYHNTIKHWSPPCSKILIHSIVRNNCKCFQKTRHSSNLKPDGMHDTIQPMAQHSLAMIQNLRLQRRSSKKCSLGKVKVLDIWVRLYEKFLEGNKVPKTGADADRVSTIFHTHVKHKNRISFVWESVSYVCAHR
jgi:hypothetical protein